MLSPFAFLLFPAAGAVANPQAQAQAWSIALYQPPSETSTSTTTSPMITMVASQDVNVYYTTITTTVFDAGVSVYDTTTTTTAFDTGVTVYDTTTTTTALGTGDPEPLVVAAPSKRLDPRATEAVLFQPETATSSTSGPLGPATAQPAMQPIVIGPVSVLSSGSASEASATTTTSAWAMPIVVPPNSVSSSSASSAPSASTSPVVAAYYPDWVSQSMAPEQVDFDRLNWVDFAFALPDGANGLKYSQDNSEQLLDRLVAAAHAKGKKVKLSIGGWSDSGKFSPVMQNPQAQQVFVNNIVDTYHQHNLDGIDIDWEYPGQSGQSGNVYNPQDTSNFLQFLQLLRSSLPPNATITAACQDWPFADQNGQPLTDASEFAKVLDWVLIMNYDVWGSSSTPGPNAPLSNGCGNSSQPAANALAAIETWMRAQFPANKLVLGLPSYGYTSQSQATQLTGRHLKRAVHGRDSLIVTNDDDGSARNGQVQFVSLVKQGALQMQNGTYVGAGGFQRSWDNCSNTPWLHSSAVNQIITYDDPASIEMKAALAKEAGLLGVEMFDVHGDTPQWELVDAGRRGLGLIQ